jgi:hypothetical protein
MVGKTPTVDVKGKGKSAVHPPVGADASTSKQRLSVPDLTKTEKVVGKAVDIAIGAKNMGVQAGEAMAAHPYVATSAVAAGTAPYTFPIIANMGASVLTSLGLEIGKAAYGAVKNQVTEYASSPLPEPVDYASTAGLQDSGVGGLFNAQSDPGPSMQDTFVREVLAPAVGASVVGWYGVKAAKKGLNTLNNMMG